MTQDNNKKTEVANFLSKMDGKELTRVTMMTAFVIGALNRASIGDAATAQQTIDGAMCGLAAIALMKADGKMLASHALEGAKQKFENLKKNAGKIITQKRIEKAQKAMAGFKKKMIEVAKLGGMKIVDKKQKSAAAKAMLHKKSNARG